MDAPPKSRVQKFIRLFSLLLSLAAVAWVLWPIWRNAWQLRRSIAGGQLAALIAAGSVAYAAITVLLTQAWWWLCRIHGARPAALAAYAVWARTQVAKYLPGNVLHYVGRQALGRQVGIGHAALAAASILEMLSLVTAAGMIGLTGAASVLTHKLAPRTQSLLLAGIVVICLFGPPLLDRLLRALPLTARRMRELPPLTPANMLRLLAPALLLHVIFFIGNGLIMFGLLRSGWPAIPAQMSQVLWIYSIAWMVGTVTPGASGGVGVREALITLQLTPLVGQANAAVLAVAFRLITVLGDILTAAAGYAIHLPRSRALPESPSDHEGLR